MKNLCVKRFHCAFVLCCFNTPQIISPNSCLHIFLSSSLCFRIFYLVSFFFSLSLFLPVFLLLEFIFNFNISSPFIQWSIFVLYSVLFTEMKPPNRLQINTPRTERETESERERRMNEKIPTKFEVKNFFFSFSWSSWSNNKFVIFIVKICDYSVNFNLMLNDFNA